MGYELTGLFWGGEFRQGMLPVEGLTAVFCDGQRRRVECLVFVDDLDDHVDVVGVVLNEWCGMFERCDRMEGFLRYEVFFGGGV